MKSDILYVKSIKTSRHVKHLSLRSSSVNCEAFTSLWRAKKAAFSLASFSDWHWGPWIINPLDSFTWHTTGPFGGQTVKHNKLDPKVKRVPDLRWGAVKRCYLSVADKTEIGRGHAHAHAETSQLRHLPAQGSVSRGSRRWRGQRDRFPRRVVYCCSWRGEAYDEKRVNVDSPLRCRGDVQLHTQLLAWSPFVLLLASRGSCVYRLLGCWTSFSSAINLQHLLQNQGSFLQNPTPKKKKLIQTQAF